MNIILHSSVNTVSFDAQYDSSNSENMISERVRTVSGNDFVYVFSTYKSFNYNVLYMPFDDGVTLNEWWRDNETLTLLDEDSVSHSVKITSNAPPFASLQASPYQDQWEGNVQLEALEAV